MVSYTRRAIKGSIIIFIGIFFGAFLAYLIRIFLSRQLTTEEFGLFWAVYSFVVFFSLFRDLGLRGAIVKFIPELKVEKKYDEIKSMIIITCLIQLMISIVFAFMIFIFSDFLAVHYFKNNGSIILLHIFSIMFVVGVFDELLKKIFNGFQETKLIAFMEFGHKAIVLGLMYLLMKKGLGIAAPALAYVFGSTLIFLLLIPSFIKVFNIFKYKLEMTYGTAKKLLLFGIPVTFMSVGGMVISYMDILMLTYFRTLTEVGIYSIVASTGLLIIFIIRSIVIVIFPMSSEMWAKKEYDKIRIGMKKLFKYALIIIVPIILGLAAYSEVFLNIFFGKAYIAGATAMKIFLMGALFYAITLLYNGFLSGIGKPKIVAKIIMYAAAMNFIANLILIPKYGMIGAAIGTGISYVFSLIMSKYYILKIIKIKFAWGEIIRIAVSGLAFIGVINILKKVLQINIYLEVMVVVGSASALYIALIFIQKLVTIKEIKKMIKT